MATVTFMDTEVSETQKRALDFGAIKENGDKIHTGSVHEFSSFVSGSDFLCGHNIIEHDNKYFDAEEGTGLIDTLYLSPIIYPSKPYHALVKDDKLQTDELNNPLNDAMKARDLFYDEVNDFALLDMEIQQIYFMLLKDDVHFAGFFDYIGFSRYMDVESAIVIRFFDRICENAPLRDIIRSMPVELAFCLALLSAGDEKSIIPRWVLLRYPKVDLVSRLLCGTSCGGCRYCKDRLNPVKYLNKYFGYKEFRKYNGEPLQEKAINAAVAHKSLLAIFPTGGGKSLTFQIPALMAGETNRGLTIVISPLQSLMKDQVDNLEKKGIPDAVTINGLLSPIERMEAIERVESGLASIIYISPESLRSNTIERLFLSRRIDRFVIDEAHCFSAWGQDFRVDYLYIGDFIKELQEKKGNECRIPVSCFTATAKQKVISDIKDYFKNKLDLDLELYATNAARTNLRYEILYRETDAEKYDTLRDLIEVKNCPTIVYVSRTKRSVEIAEKLSSDGFAAKAFNGKMDRREKQENQEAFIKDEIQVMVATSAFGMGVDKPNVGLVIHYDISDSLENYVQEAGRAGRDQSLNAECYVLFNDNDLDKHFVLLNQTKLSISEIQQVWKAVKGLTKNRSEVCCSPFEMAKYAGWDESVSEVETRVKTALLALENAGYIKRGKNVPRIYATSIMAKDMIEASGKIDSSHKFQNDAERLLAKRIIKFLISSRSRADAGNEDAESRVDYLADKLGVEQANVIASIQQMKSAGLLADTKDLTAYIQKSDTENKSLTTLKKFRELEEFLLKSLSHDGLCINYKELNEAALDSGLKNSTISNIKTLLYYWMIRNYVKKDENQTSEKASVRLSIDIDSLNQKRKNSYFVSEFIVKYLYGICVSSAKNDAFVEFSELELMEKYNTQTVFSITEADIEEALLFLSKIGALRLEGGFLVLYSGMRIKRLNLDNQIRYKQEDYKLLNEHYQQKMQQIHIVGEYANMMTRDYNEALKFVNDYFQMDYKKFIALYFSGERSSEINRNITPKKYKQIFEELSKCQLEIINDKDSKNIVVAAGPGSGKTKVLVHKLASLLLMEDVKHEQLLMLTFSRAAAIEFKKRLRELIGNAANFVEIKTFHSYCFDLLGKFGNEAEFDKVVKEAVELLRNGEADLGKITKTVLVIDEAQDMDENEYGLVEFLMEHNDELRVIAVGDDDQNIYEFRGSDSKFMRALVSDHDAKQYSLLDNYRSCGEIVDFSNYFVTGIKTRMKRERIRAVKTEKGNVRLIKHTGENMINALVNDLISEKPTGSTCVLAPQNKDALMVLGMLRQQGIAAKLIQSLSGFNIYDIAEIRFFLKKLDALSKTPVISSEQWKNALEYVEKRFRDNACLPVILKILKTFDENYEKKYRTDLEVFLNESKIEDFYETEQGVITVSTLHKSKGREFDNVYMYLEKLTAYKDEEKRKLYVGMTRAKKNLRIHYSGDWFDSYKGQASLYETDPKNYAKPKELIMQLSHKDVYLDFFKGKNELFFKELKLKSGDHLIIENNCLYKKMGGKRYSVVRLSKERYEMIKTLAQEGYMAYDAVIGYICAWTKKDDIGTEKEEESPVVLADIFLRLE
ncbi:MAG: RecQ family ATP-dependent DNA helicase [Lachnospiraceae bacterium]|nr:RecQ family ATP-dependent DNA helicase [Lachnospiraceae bacterium]